MINGYTTATKGAANEEDIMRELGERFCAVEVQFLSDDDPPCFAARVWWDQCEQKTGPWYHGLTMKEALLALQANPLPLP